MNENQFENILAKYPELIEEGLSLTGRQVNIRGKFVDLVFKDRHGQHLVVELKRGTVKREHIGQLMDYEGFYLSGDGSPIRVMLIGNRVPPNFRRSLEYHGFEWREIELIYLQKHLEKKQDLEFLKYLSDYDNQTKNIEDKSAASSTPIVTAACIDNNYINIGIDGPLIKKSTNTLFRQHKEQIDNEHLFCNFTRYNWMDENGISKRAVALFSRKTCNLITIPSILINQYFFHKFFELKDDSGYKIKDGYKDYERNTPVVGLKFDILPSNHLLVSLEAYRTSTSKDIKLFSLPQEYWDIFRPNPQNVEIDLIDAINKRLSKNEIEQGKGILVL